MNRWTWQCYGVVVHTDVDVLRETLHPSVWFSEVKENNHYFIHIIRQSDFNKHRLFKYERKLQIIYKLHISLALNSLQDVRIMFFRPALESFVIPLSTTYLKIKCVKGFAEWEERYVIAASSLNILTRSKRIARI